jgi:hypothetical protein
VEGFHEAKMMEVSTAESPENTPDTTQATSTVFPDNG